MPNFVNPFRFAAAGGSDPHASSVVFLCHFDGADGAKTATEETGKALGFFGNAQIDTAQAKYGSASLLIGGVAGSRMRTPDHADWRWGSGQFTIEAAVRFTGFGTGTGAGQAVAARWTPFGLSWTFRMPDSAPGELSFLTSKDESSVLSNIVTSGAGLVADRWYQVAVDRDATNTVRIYVDGVVRAAVTQTDPTIADALGTNLSVGGEDSDTNRPLRGWVDEVRVTKGVARYAGAYTPASAAFPNP